MNALAQCEPERRVLCVGDAEGNYYFVVERVTSGFFF